MFSPLKKHDGFHQTCFSFCRITRNINKLKWLRSLLILDSVIYMLILFRKLPRQSSSLADFVHCSQCSRSSPSTPYPGMDFSPLSLSCVLPAGGVWANVPVMEHFPPNTWQTWPSSFLQGLCAWIIAHRLLQAWASTPCPQAMSKLPPCQHSSTRWISGFHLSWLCDRLKDWNKQGIRVWFALKCCKNVLCWHDTTHPPGRDTVLLSPFSPWHFYHWLSRTTSNISSFYHLTESVPAILLICAG